jgi:hypothetical protein
MKIIERILISMVALGCILQFFSLPLENFIVFISLVTSAVFYFIFSFALFNDLKINQIFKKKSYYGINAHHAIYTVYCGFVFSAILFGLTYSILHYEQSILMFYFGVLFLFLLLVFTVIKYFQRRTQFYKAILIRVIIFIVLFGLHLLIV